MLNKMNVSADYEPLLEATTSNLMGFVMKLLYDLPLPRRLFDVSDG